MDPSDKSLLDYHAIPGAITRLDKYRAFLDWLRDVVRAIVQVVPGQFPLDFAALKKVEIVSGKEWLFPCNCTYRM
jgi:hypothetical protein